MTKQEFDCIIARARLTQKENCSEIFDIVSVALNEVNVLEDIDGDTNGQ